MNAVQTNPVTLHAQHIHQPGKRLRPSRDLLEYCRQYARQRPEVVALLCVGLGFVVGWKLKLW
jgi:hypothetical protein